MTADDTPAVPDTEAEREALAWFRATPHVLEAKWLGTEPFPRHAATIVRVALARDVPAPADEPVAQMLSVLRRERDRYDRDDNDIERHEHDLIDDLIRKCEHAALDADTDSSEEATRSGQAPAQPDQQDGDEPSAVDTAGQDACPRCSDTGSKRVMVRQQLLCDECGYQYPAVPARPTGTAASAAPRCTCDPGPDGYPHRQWCEQEYGPHAECATRIESLEEYRVAGGGHVPDPPVTSREHIEAVAAGQRVESRQVTTVTTRTAWTENTNA